MADLSTLDKRLISKLKADGRASVTTLAAELKVSRATIQSRMEKLARERTIQRYTVDIDPSAGDDLIRAVMMIEVEGAMTRTVTRTLKTLTEIVSLYTTNGSWDLVAQIETANLRDFDGVLRKVREIKGVLNSETSILLNRIAD